MAAKGKEIRTGAEHVAAAIAQHPPLSSLHSERERVREREKDRIYTPQ